MIAGADVVLENFRPGVFSRLGFDQVELDRLNPTLIFASASGFGSSGPMVDKPGQDILVQARSGLISVTGTPEVGPTPVGAAVVDQHGGALRGTFFLTQAVAKRMVARAEAPEDRSIVFITSANAHLVSPEKGPYCISKAGLSMASQQYALRLAEHGIGVYEIRPGLIMTDMTADVAERYTPQIENGSICAVRRWGQPHDIARGIATLVTGGMPFSTGDVYNIGGGMQIPRL